MDQAWRQLSKRNCLRGFMKVVLPAEGRKAGTTVKGAIQARAEQEKKRERKHEACTHEKQSDLGNCTVLIMSILLSLGGESNI